MRIPRHLLSVLFSAALACSLFAEVLPPLPEGAVTLAVIPDTQRYKGEGRRVKKGAPAAKGPVKNASFVSCVDWLLANQGKERIFFVSHTGDIVDNLNDFQMTFARQQMSRLDGRLPYAIAPGNHDIKVANTDLFCKYFPAEKFAREPWYAGHFGGYTNVLGEVVCRDNANSCQLVEAGGVKFVFLHLECNAPDPVLAWADTQLTKHADRRAVVVTHQDLGFVERRFQDAWKNSSMLAYEYQERIDKGKKPKVGMAPPPQPNRAELGRLRWKKCHGVEGNTPQQAWEKCFSKHKNLLMILSGDQGPVNVAREISVGRHGNRVFCAMHDTQTHAIRLYRFLPGLKKIEVWSVNPATGELLTAYRGWQDCADHNFIWELGK